MRMKWVFWVAQLSILAGALMFGVVQESYAEGVAVGYFLGSSGPMAGVTPPPGFYIRNDIYHYSGTSDKLVSPDALQYPLSGEHDISTTSLVNTLGVSWVPDMKVLGARFALGGGIAYGRKTFWADFEFAPIFGIQAEPTRLDGESVGISDMGVIASLGWQGGFSHWKVYTSVVAPTGEYKTTTEDGEVQYVNMGNNRWGFDVGAGYTYLNMDNGFEASLQLGLVFNGKNEDTELDPGIESHVEAALVEHFGNRLSLGVVGYYYYQVTEDEGPGAYDVLGRLAGAGPTIGYFFTAGETLFSLNVRWYHEFSAYYRLEGDAIFGSIAVSL